MLLHVSELWVWRRGLREPGLFERNRSAGNDLVRRVPMPIRSIWYAITACRDRDPLLKNAGNTSLSPSSVATPATLTAMPTTHATTTGTIAISTASTSATSTASPLVHHLSTGDKASIGVGAALAAMLYFWAWRSSWVSGAAGLRRGSPR